MYHSGQLGLNLGPSASHVRFLRKSSRLAAHSAAESVYFTSRKRFFLPGFSYAMLTKCLADTELFRIWLNYCPSGWVGLYLQITYFLNVYFPAYPPWLVPNSTSARGSSNAHWTHILGAIGPSVAYRWDVSIYRYRWLSSGITDTFLNFIYRFWRILISTVKWGKM